MLAARGTRSCASIARIGLTPAKRNYNANVPMPTPQPEIEEFVISTVALACNRNPATVAASADLQQLGIDSMAIVTFISYLEAEYQCELSDAQLSAAIRSETVAQLIGIAKSVADPKSPKS